jgi:ATP-dependent exoDNAse (exonuclease V) beta subunit
MWDEKGSAKNLSVEKSDSTIELMTIHKAKGLEKKVVIIPYCSWQLDPIINNTVWATPEQRGELSEIGQFPVNYNGKMEQSIYADEYFREKIYSHVDAVNMLYVALTRAKEELYAFIPRNKKGQLTGIGTLLWGAVDAKAVKSEDGSRSYAEFGIIDGPAPKKENDKSDEKSIENVLMHDYPTTGIEAKPRISSQRYFEDTKAASLAPRNVGIIMHEILNKADNAEDVISAIVESKIQGRLSDEQAAEMEAIIKREFAREQVAQWFGEWDEVRRENDILCTAEAGTRRPDRVMIKGDKAVVVDYKFGEEKLSSHRKQIKNYIKLLHEMGYTCVEGYAWYLSLGEIVRIEN